MLFLGRKNRLVNQAPLTAHTETHNLLMHYENHLEELPPLPPLEQPWEDNVRTHTSFQGLAWEPFETPEDSEANDYEQLEHVGDAFLNRGTGRLIVELYPRLTVGEQTALLAVLIANFSIAFVSRAYKLADRMLAHHTQLEELQHNYGIQADLLESYLGGVYRQYGKSYTLEFVQKLFRPLVIAAYNDRKMLWAKKVAAEAEEAAIKASEEINLAESAALEDGDDGEPDPMRDFVSLLHQYGSRRKQRVTFVKVGLHKMVAKLGDEKAGSYSALEGHTRNWQHIKQLAAKNALVSLGFLKPDASATPFISITSHSSTAAP